MHQFHPVWMCFLLAVWVVLACCEDPDSGQTDSGLDGFADAAGEDGSDAIQGTDGEQNADSGPVCDPSVSTDEQARFEATANWSDSVEGDALLIMKCGQVVFEHYKEPTTADTAHMLASGTKSFACALFALGQADGLWSLDENVSETIVEWTDVARKSDIRIEHLLSLTSGLVDSPEYQATKVRTLDTYDLAINDSTIDHDPGQACIYAPSNFQVLAALFERKTGGTDPVLFLYDRLLSMLGFSEDHLARWTRDIEDKPQMAGGAYFTARAWANYGKLFLQKGTWQGEQLLDAATVELCTSYENPAFSGYGLSWWLNRPTGDSYDPAIDQLPADGIGDGAQIASNAPEDMYMAAGTGKQRLYVIPSLQLVVVRFGSTIGNPDWSDHVFFSHLLGT